MSSHQLISKSHGPIKTILSAMKLALLSVSKNGKDGHMDKYLKKLGRLFQVLKVLKVC